MKKEMRIKKDDLLTKLEAVKPGLSNKDIIEFADSFSFHENQLITYNDFICVKCPIDLDLQGTIKSDHFYQIIKKFKTDKNGELIFKIKNNELIIKSNKAKAGVPINREGKITLHELGEIPEKWKKLPDDFSEGIRLSAFAAGNDASEPILTCLHIHSDIIESSNGQRAFKYHMEKEINKTFLLPAFSVPALLQHPIKFYNISKNWLHFKTKENLIISCRMYEDEQFPDTDFLFNISGSEIHFPDKIKDSIERAIVFTDTEEDDNDITIEIDKKETLIQSKSKNGWFKERISNKSKTKVSFEINPFFLKDILKSSAKAIIDKKGGNLLKFSADKWEYVINIFMNSAK